MFVGSINKLRAQLVYVDVNPDSCVCASAVAYSNDSLSTSWDLDHDGTYDFKINSDVNNTGDCMHGNDNTFLIALGSNQIVGNSTGILMLNSADTISSYSTWGTSTILENFSEFFGWTGYWKDSLNNGTGFAGVRFLSGTTLYYGWIHLAVTTGCSFANALVKDYAYSTSAITMGVKNIYTPSSTFQIYPNPASSSIELSLAGNSQNTSITVSDMLGNTVGQAVLYNSSTVINVADFTEGVYTLSISNAMGVVTKRLVIVR